MARRYDAGRTVDSGVLACFAAVSALIEIAGRNVGDRPK